MKAGTSTRHSSALNIALDESGNVYLAGFAGDGYPTTADAYQTTNACLFDAFVTRLNPVGGGANDLVYSTYLGGADNDHAYALAVDGNGGTIDVAGSTFGAIPTTPGAFRAASAGSLDVFLARFAALPPPQPRDLFLHASGPRGRRGAATNPPIFFLDETQPTTTSTMYSDSAALELADGNSWSAVGTWSASPELVSTSLVGFDALHAWLGLKNNNDQGTRFDVRAELLRNGALISSGEVYCVQGITRNPGNAREIAVPFAPILPAPFDGTSDVLSLRLMTRIGTDGSNFCGGHSNARGLRVYYDTANRPAKFTAYHQQ